MEMVVMLMLYVNLRMYRTWYGTIPVEVLHLVH